MVSIVEAVRAPLVSKLELSGSVTARRDARLSARASGLVLDLKVDAGDVVKAGDVLMQLDAELAEIELEMAIVEKQAAEIRLLDARRLEKEVRNLTRSGAFARSEAESRETAVRVAEAALKGAEVLEKQQRALIERHRLLAPFDGVIREKVAEVGEWVETGTPVVELVETGRLWMDVQVPQEHFRRLSSDPELQVRLESFPDQPIPGRVAVIVPLKDPVARTFLARIEMDDGIAAPGGSGKVSFSFKGEEVVQVPRDAVIRFPNGTAELWVVRENNGKLMAKSRPVKVGGSFTEMIEVTEGLAEGERVILRGNEGMTDGQAVEITSKTSEE